MCRWQVLQIKIDKKAKSEAQNYKKIINFINKYSIEIIKGENKEFIANIKAARAELNK